MDKLQDSLLKIPDTSATLGVVVKTSPENTFCKVGSIIIVKDNVSTPIRFDSEEYLATEELSVVGIIQDNDMLLENAEILNEYILMKPYISKNVLNSTILETPYINYEDLDYSNIHNRDLFRVIYADKNLQNIHGGDIILLNRDYTNYLYYDNEKYFVINGKKWISGKVIERDSLCKT